MVGLEYICGVYQKQFKVVAEELGIPKQSINQWLNGYRKIPNERLTQLSEMFGLDEEFFQKELSDLEKSQIFLFRLSKEIKGLKLDERKLMAEMMEDELMFLNQYE